VPGLFNRMTLSSLMAYSLLSTGMDDLEDHPEYAAYLSPSSTTFEHNSIFRINTCLWGGKYNPVIPYFRQIPKWWDRDNLRFETAAQIINRYLDFFEPDFIVEAEAGLAEGLGFDQDRIFQLSSILTREDDQDWSGHGLNVFELYRDLYRKEFQFARRHEHNIIDVTAKKQPFSKFSACVFGAFPPEPDLKYLGQAFKDAFGPKEVSLNGASLAELYRSGFTSALRLGHSKIEVDYHDHHRDPALFVLDALESRDLIDYWNLRAIRRQVVPVPVQWLEDLSEYCKEFIVENHRPLPGNPNGVMIHATVMFARSIPTHDIERIHRDYFRVNVADANVLQTSYPSIWRPSPGFAIREGRPTLSAAEKTFDIPFITEKPEIRFDCLHPEFADEYGNKNRWANVVRLHDWTHKDQIATVFPCDYKNPTYPKFSLIRDTLLPTTEGFVIFPQYRSIPERWEIPDGTTAINKWLKTYGIKAVLSDAGRATQQIIQTMGGFWGVTSFAHAGIVKLLNEISRRPMSRSAHHHEFKNRINNAIKNDTWRGGNFETLVERNAVELGLELKCTKCSSWSWYSLRQLDYQMNCSLCLRQFGFPIIDPSNSCNSRWAYRLIGPFALPDYAKGGYAASLSIRFFSEIAGEPGRAAVTWSGGQELELGPENKVESDFILWYQRKEFLGNDYRTEIIFGEAKSFGRDAFLADDVERMKTLAVRFPGAVIVFSTMKRADELSPDEVSRIAKLAEWGREYVRERRQTRAPVIVLTGTELFVPFSLEETWKKIGGRHAQLIEPGWIRADNLRVLADLTQQLYLNMPSYGTWLKTKWKKRTARHKVKFKQVAT
ncbi:hypothetical protein, partial [Methylocaldum sp.]|uniref:hypothetical protein n=1 Tax=Methylocaldum sp. TaxID=1969727 RepID=UPI002D5ED4F5